MLGNPVKLLIYQESQPYRLAFLFLRHTIVNNCEDNP